MAKSSEVAPIRGGGDGHDHNAGADSKEPQNWFVTKPGTAQPLNAWIMMSFKR